MALLRYISGYCSYDKEYVHVLWVYFGVISVLR